MFVIKLTVAVRLFNPPDPLESLMTANQMHIHGLINQLATNGYTNAMQNATDSLGDTRSFHFNPRLSFGPN